MNTHGSRAQRRWRPAWPIGLDPILQPLTRGPRDPVARRTGPGQWWLTAGTTDGPTSLALQQDGPEVVAQAWGGGAHRLLDGLPRMLGAADDPAGFDPAPGTVVGHQWRLHGQHWRVPATGLVWESLLLAVLEQKVTGVESRRSWYRLCLDHGQPAPGPAPPGMQVVPGFEAVAAVPSWWWRAAGVDHQRAGTLLRLAGHRRHIRAAGEGDLDLTGARQVLSAVPGVGPWTLAEVACRALGDADAVSVGDFHLANSVGYALTGAHRSTDAQLLELLAPFTPHRYRAVRMVELAGITAPRRGPRAAIPDHR
jgi:3-methyladenine DNA glycosylase/8-oxoguanine DNA glycosylase